CLLLSAYCLLLSAYCLLPTAYCLLLTAFRLPPTAFCLPPSAFCLLPSADRPAHSTNRSGNLGGSYIRARVGTAKRDQMLARLIKRHLHFKAFVCGVGDAISRIDQLPRSSIDAVFTAHDTASNVGRVEIYHRRLT